MFKTDILDALSDSELEQAENYIVALKKKRDAERKAQAMAEARAILAAAGISMKDLAARSKSKAKPAPYRNGHHYQHPKDKSLVWNGAGKKPNWLRALENDGEEAVEVPA
jgi:DNA-binding protein H-NS